MILWVNPKVLPKKNIIKLKTLAGEEYAEVIYFYNFMTPKNTKLPLGKLECSPHLIKASQLTSPEKLIKQRGKELFVEAAAKFRSKLYVSVTSPNWSALLSS